MLRTYTPLRHNDIFTLHTQLEYLVCNVWCNAADGIRCEDLLEATFEVIYTAYNWLKIEVDTIYEKCKALSPQQRVDIRAAFNINNRIEELCEGPLSPIPLNLLPAVVEDDMAPLLIRFYEYLLDRAEVSGDKLTYYNELIERNGFTTCPCCGLSLIESAETHYREDNDHYLPKSEYPFATVNFHNLVPLCGKCNKKCKGTKNPFEPGRLSFYPFNGNRPNIGVSINVNDSEELDYRALKIADITVSFDNDANKIDTWDWLFKIKERYNKETRDFSKTELRTIANRLFRNNKRKLGLTYDQILNDTIEDYEIELYEDRKFLKVSFLRAIQVKPEWQAVYNIGY